VVSMDNDSENKDEELDSSWYPTSVEELHELLTFYRKQTIVFKKERAEYENTLKSLKMSNEEKHKLEWALHKKSQLNDELTKQLSDTNILLYSEKNDNIEHKSQIKSLKAEVAELHQNKEHLVELLQSANDNLHDILEEPKRHKQCGACTHHHQTQRIIRNKVHRENHPRKLTTIYLPNDPADTLRSKLEAKEEELLDLKQHSLASNEFLRSDRDKAQRDLEALRAEYDSKFERLQQEIERLSREHLYNLKEYLNYRRTTKQEMHDLQIGALQMKQQSTATKEECVQKVEHLVSSTNEMEKRITKRSNKMIHGFRMETIKKHEELNHVKDALKTMSKSYECDVKQLKSKLHASKRKNKRLSQINKCQKIGVQTDVDNLKKRLQKLQKSMDALCLDETTDAYQSSLQSEITKVKERLMDLARITQSS